MHVDVRGVDAKISWPVQSELGAVAIGDSCATTLRRRSTTASFPLRAALSNRRQRLRLMIR